MASGAWESIVIDGRRFACKSNDNVNYTLDGFENEVMTGGDGSTYLHKTKHTGSISSITLFLNNENEDASFLQQVQDKMDFVSVSGTMIDGTVLSGNMQLTDKLEINSGENTVGVSLEGHLEIQG